MSRAMRIPEVVGDVSSLMCDTAGKHGARLLDANFDALEISKSCCTISMPSLDLHSLHDVNICMMFSLTE